MKWLLTVPAKVDLEELGRRLEAHGVTVDLGSCIPLHDGEQVVEAEGPEEIGAVLERVGADAVKASPSSDLELFGPTDESGGAESDPTGVDP